MASHTPGPWTILEVHSGEYQVGSVGQTAAYEGMDVAVCRILVGSWDGEPPQKQIEANARLIAAAPELLAACFGLVDILHMTNAKCSFGVPLTPLNNPCDCNQHAAYHAARAAISKAKGDA